VRIIVPKLRFKEFNDGWKNTKLSNFITKITDKNKKYLIKNVISNSAQYGLIPQKEFFDKDIANDENINNYYIIEKGDFVYNPRKSIEAPYGPVNMYCYSKKGIISPLYLCFKVFNINKDFLLKYFKTACWHKYIYENGDSGARHDRVSIKDDLFFELPIFVPSMQEQEKIGKLFELLDKKIELQKQKIEALKLYKKGLLQKIMNDNGQKVKIKDILEEYSEKTTINNQYESISSTKEGLFLQKEYFNRSIASENNIGYKILKINQVVLSPQNLWMGNINYNDKYEIGIVSPSYKIFNINNEFNKYYIFNLLKSEKALYYYTISSEQGASIVRRNLNIEAFEEITFNIPDRKTQNIIGMNIKLIDFKIKLNENKFNYLYNYKKSLLQQMFI